MKAILCVCGIFVISLFTMVESLTGSNVCTKASTRDVVTYKAITATEFRRIVFCCNGAQSCSTDGTCQNKWPVVVTRTLKITNQVPINVTSCCDGYHQVGDSCQPTCATNKCIRGRCIAPEVCDCTGTGYAGVTCNIIQCDADERPCVTECSSSNSSQCVCHECYTPSAGKCVNKHRCLINGVCYRGGAISENECLTCIPLASQTQWTPSSKSKMCNDGNKCTRLDKCNGLGQCVGQSFTCSGECNECNGMSCFLNTTCAAQTTTTATTTTTTTTTTTSSPTPPRGNIDEVSCRAKIGVLHAISNNCRKFYYCVPGHPQPYVLDCPGNLYFEPQYGVCVHKYQIQRTDCNQSVP
ncbi:protein psiQ-like [Hydractinia symbiolongicarpus]|uniref:protein psiQ-like n=1 Tax=Hydractinia symbiolongicarpus TaxID=13093 RepID=UPI00254AD69E|nr:protein psiQ-like [Hydractinia symbiolongicarpus]